MSARQVFYYGKSVQRRLNLLAQDSRRTSRFFNIR